MEDTKPIIKIGEKGPLIIKGGATLIYSDGREEIKEKTVEKEIQEFIDKKENSTIKNNKTKSINYFNLFLVMIISLIALIILIETFKNQISFVYPNIDFALNNLYETLNDVKLFFIDLVK